VSQTYVHWEVIHTRLMWNVNHFYVNNTECETDLMSSGRLFLQAFEILSSGQVLIGVLRQLCVYSHTRDIDKHRYRHTHIQTDRQTDFIHKFKPYSLEIYPMCKYELATLRHSKVIIRQTDRHGQNYIPLLLYYAALLVVNNIRWHDSSWTILNSKLTMLELLNIY